MICSALLNVVHMQENKNETKKIKDQTHWTDTKGIANHFNMKPGTIRKQRSKQTKNAFPFHKVGGCVRYSILECEKFMENNTKEYA